MASDGKRKIKAMLPSHFASEIHSGNLHNLGLIRILDYTCNSVPNQPEKALIVTKCEVVSPALDCEIKNEVSKEDGAIRKEVKPEENGVVLNPKQEVTTKSAAQIMQEQRIKFHENLYFDVATHMHSAQAQSNYGSKFSNVAGGV